MDVYHGVALEGGISTSYAQLQVRLSSIGDLQPKRFDARDLDWWHAVRKRRRPARRSAKPAVLPLQATRNLQDPRIKCAGHPAERHRVLRAYRIEELRVVEEVEPLETQL